MTTLGVIVARFQVPYLHAGHRFIIERAIRNNAHVLVILGESGGTLTAHDPLTVDERRAMITRAYPSVTTARLRDVGDDAIWSADLDEIIALMYIPHADVTLYGGPDSFLPHYKGIYNTEQVAPPPSISGTALRAQVTPPGGAWREAFREGMIYAANLRKPTSFQTVDIAVINDYAKPRHVLMGTRRGDDGLRFPGGFVDPSDLSLEYAARRELREEVPSLSADGFAYQGSYRINDWRYRNAPDKIMTALFIAFHQYGPAEAGDDFRDAHWVPLRDLSARVASVHRPLADRVTEVLAQAEEEQRVR